VDMQPIFLSLHDAGTPEHPRHVISDRHLRFWCGTEWSGDLKQALLYHDANEACAEVQRLLMLEYGDKPRRRFIAPVYVDLYSDTEVSERDLRHWLSRACRLLVNPANESAGPAAGSLGLVNINWAEMDEKDM
jgi:hypothetical protein